MAIDYDEVPVTLGGGEIGDAAPADLRVGDLGLRAAATPDVMLSPRVAPQMIGLGLLEAMPAADILALADPDDADGDGISGRPNIVWSEAIGRPMLGRFGHKAGQPTIRDQAAAAFSGDIGISTTLHPGRLGRLHRARRPPAAAAPDGGAPEADDTGARPRHLLQPQPRGAGAARPRRPGGAGAARRLFHEAGCAACHRPKFVTDRLDGQPEQSFQLIWPYTDLLLHDMGEGLADHRPEARRDRDANGAPRRSGASG